MGPNQASRPGLWSVPTSLFQLFISDPTTRRYMYSLADDSLVNNKQIVSWSAQPHAQKLSTTYLPNDRLGTAYFPSPEQGILIYLEYEVLQILANSDHSNDILRCALLFLVGCSIVFYPGRLGTIYREG
jgi:hypothetical protein